MVQLQKYVAKTEVLLLIIMLLTLAACQNEPAITPATLPAVPLPPPQASAIPTVMATATVSATAVAKTLYLPLVESQLTATAINSPPSPTPTPAYPRYTGPAINRDDIGIQIHLHREDQRDILRHLETLDIGWVKVQVSWKLYQPARDQFAEDRFDELDRLVEAANNNDIKVLLSVSKAPEWSRSITEQDGPPTEYQQYRTFMQHLAERYTGQVAAYELWNEPNLQREWNGTALNATNVVALISEGAAGVRAADPAATIISSPPATTGINDAIVAIDDRLFMRQMLAAGLADHVDAIGVHPYGWANPPASSNADVEQLAPTHNNHPSFFFSDTINDYSALLTEFGQADKPLWVTEFGWGSFEMFAAQPPAGAEFMTAVSEWQQATYILGAYELAHGWKHVGPMILWNLNFAPTLGADFSESGYSILRPDGSRRPAYLALENLAKQSR